MTDALTRLPDAELEVMQALWALDTYPAHTADIAARLERDWKAPTLLKLLSRLEERGFVRGRRPAERTCIPRWSPKRTI